MNDTAAGIATVPTEVCRHVADWFRGQAYPRVGQPLSGGRSLTSWIGVWCRSWRFTPGKDFAQLEAMRISIIGVFLVGRLQDALRIR